MIKPKLWINCVFALLVCLPVGVVSTTKIWAQEPVFQVAQARSAYDRYMQLGYTATRQRNYRRALGHFQQAAQVRPGDKYATAAIRNVTGYIQRRSGLIAFVPGRPGRVRSAASRGLCFQNTELIIPLVPSNKDAQYTTKNHPTFHFYVPKTVKPVAGLEFVLRDDDNNETLYRQTFPPVEQAGIISITPPANQPALQAGKEYSWGFSMICNLDSRDQDQYVEGKIELMQDENIAAEIQETTKPLDRAFLYATAGLWENAFTTLVDLRRQNPNDVEITKYWADLLKSVNLEEVTNQPLLPCCSPQN